ncbi:hypothetical protein BKA70DRAFT_1185439 [Coprinopsis sp. MPI-PUGE-AT-0042]|nr:hypothetical protein BKA70DRAFT_1185439 [Coprinopsis sp. MPI-PUGE-AT-0042]
MALRTLIGKSPKDIQHQLRLLVESHAHNPSVCLFTFSAIEGADWGSCWSEILRLEETGHKTLGCISSPLPSGGHWRRSGVSCSIGIFDSGSAVPFRSTIQGNEVISVGKWHSFKKPDRNASDEYLDAGSFPDGKVSWDDIWQQGRTQENEVLEDLKHVRQKDISSIIYFTDKAHQGLSRSLLHHYPAASKLGLFAPSTLTINERPRTMMWGKNVISEGAVGVALLNAKPKLDIQFNGVRAITDSLQVTGSTGNIIESLDSSNPTRLLLQALERSTSVKASTMASYASIHPLLHESVFLGTVDPSSGEPTKMYKITAGDPSRGPLSLEVGRAPSPGEHVQFFVPNATAPQLNFTKSTPAVEFMTVVEGEHLGEGDAVADEATVLQDVFFAASDAGLLAHRPNEDVECLGIGGPVGVSARIHI